MPPKQRSLFPRLVTAPRKPAARPKPARRKLHDGQIFVVKITLLGSKPPIWRRFAVPADISLGNLHPVIQVVMGWCECHLHMFVAPDKTQYTDVSGEDGADWDDEVRDEAKTRLRDLLRKPKDRCLYEYDFGDGWEHGLELEKVIEPEPGVRYPVCLAGKRACPPEDCGGPWGYANMLRALANPKHAEHAECREWLGHEFDPARFDLEETNAALRALR